MSRGLAPPATILLISAVLAACGSAGATPTASTGSGASAGTTQSAGTPGAPAGVAACDLLTDEDIADLLEATVAEKLDDVADTVYANHCRWSIMPKDGGGAEINLGIVSPGGREFYERSIAITNPTPITGLPADIATRDRNTGSIYAVKGDTVVDLFTISVVTPDEEIVTRILENLDAG